MIDQEELHNQCLSKDPKERIEALEQLGNYFSLLPDKERAWNYLYRLTNDDDISVKCGATSALGSAFPYMSDKQRAWNDLHRLANDKDYWVSSEAASAISSLFSQLPDRQQAWKDLHKLTINQDNFLRFTVVDAIGSAFFHIPDKQQAWDELIKLMTDGEIDVEYSAACALGSAFPYMPDKQQAWYDLIKLTNDEDYVYLFVNHSLGEISIFKALQAEKEGDYKKELENAIEFFEKEVQESSWLHEEWGNPSQFCLPFYRSFYTIIFKNQKAKEEVDKYLAEAKAAIYYSKNKALLFEAVKNLASALKEVQNLENLDLEAKKYELNFYRKYCDRATEIMRYTEKTAPFATGVMRKGLPILDRNLKELLEEIQKKAKIACKEAKGAVTEEIACAVSKEVQKWEIGSQEEMAFNVENLIFTLESSVPKIPENQYIFNRIQQVREQKDVPKQYGIISTIIPLIPKIYMERKVEELENDIKEIKEKIDYLIISLKPGIKEEIEISVGTEILGTGVTHKITIPLQEISYSELKEDLEKITGIKIDKLSKIPKKLANKIKGYLLLHDRDDILENLI